MPHNPLHKPRRPAGPSPKRGGPSNRKPIGWASGDPDNDTEKKRTPTKPSIKRGPGYKAPGTSPRFTRKATREKPEAKAPKGGERILPGGGTQQKWLDDIKAANKKIAAAKKAGTWRGLGR